MFTLDTVVPWGRSFAEYRAMFALTDDDCFRRKVLGCADGPASFNAEANRLGGYVISCDPLYAFGAEAIQQRINATFATMLEQTRRNLDEFVWTIIRSVDELGAVRRAAMDSFLLDFSEGRKAGRYIDAALPTLPFTAESFDLVLCSHFLFLYSTQLGEEFHDASVAELCRVGKEVRIFPLLALGGRRSAFVDAAIARAHSLGLNAAIAKVPYEFQRGGNEMLRITRC